MASIRSGKRELNMKKFHRDIEYRDKDGFTEVVHCDSIKGIMAYYLIRFVTWLENKVESEEV